MTTTWHDRGHMRQVTRLLLVALVATAIVVAPPLGNPAAEAAPMSTDEVNLGDEGIPVTQSDAELSEVPNSGVVPREEDGVEGLPGGEQGGGALSSEDGTVDSDAVLDSPEESAGAEEDARSFISDAFPADNAAMVGVEVDGGLQPGVAIRTSVSGEWSEWQSLVFPEVEDGPDPETDEARNAVNVTEPLWIGEVDEIQVHVRGDVEPEAVKVHRVKIDGSLDFDPLASPAGAAHASVGPGVIPRSAWDPNNECAPRSGASTAPTVRFSVIHHTAGSNNYTKAQAANQLRGICLYHRNANGWNDVGYNIVVDRYGRTYEGRAGGLTKAVIGAHAAGYNSGSVGVAVMGCFDRSCSSGLGNNSLPQAALAAVDQAVAWQFAVYGVAPNGTTVHSGRTIDTIVGHRDVGSTACPGSNFVPYVNGHSPMRHRVARLISQFAPPWERARAGTFGSSGRDGLMVLSPATGELLVNDSTGSAFVLDSWGRFATTSGWDAQVVGDFTGNGRDEVASFHGGNGTWWVSASNGSSFTTTRWNRFSTTSGWTHHLVGDFNKSGKDDIASYHAPSGRWWVSTSNGSSFSSTHWSSFSTPAGWQTHLVGDFTGNGYDDIMSYHPNNGSWWLLRSTGSSFRLQRWSTFATQAGWTEHLVGDITGNGRADIASFHPKNNTWWISQPGNGKLNTSRWTTYSTSSGWQTHVLGDVTGDERDDLISYSQTSGNMVVNRSTGSSFRRAEIWATFSTRDGWGTHVLLDVNNDGRLDVASYHPSNASWWVSRSNGSTFRTSRWN